jgi:uncharacterized phage-associated protein
VAGPPYDARAIANEFLKLADQSRRSLTLLALMKMVYFAHGYHLAERGTPLVLQQFEAWENGPVVRAIWEALRDCGSSIPKGISATRFNPLLGRHEPIPDVLDEATLEVLRGVFAELHRVHPFTLVAMTHEERSPWDEVWRTSNKANLGMKIDDDAIREWFLRPQLGH